jgi:hypothetical protein
MSHITSSTVAATLGPIAVASSAQRATSEEIRARHTPNMFEFTLEWTNSHSRTERAINAKAATDNIDVREALILPLLILIAFLLSLGILTGAHFHERADRALSYVAFGGMGIPTLHPSSDSCRRPPTLGSVPHLRHADVLALLATD